MTFKELILVTYMFFCAIYCVANAYLTHKAKKEDLPKSEARTKILINSKPLFFTMLISICGMASALLMAIYTVFI